MGHETAVFDSCHMAKQAALAGPPGGRREQVWAGVGWCGPASAGVGWCELAWAGVGWCGLVCPEAQKALGLTWATRRPFSTAAI